MSVTFSDRNGWHLYRLDGDRVPSVTTIVNGGVPKHLTRWAASVVANAVADMPSTVDAVRDLGRDALVAALVELPEQAKRKAGIRGTEIHALAVQLVAGEPVEPPPDLVEPVEGYARWLDDSGFVDEWSERIIGNRAHRYAGRFDVIGTWRGQRWLLDVKTGRGVYGETSLQCAAYARAEFLVDDDGTELVMPHVNRIGVLHVQPGVTELFDLGSIDEGFAEFVAAQRIYAGNTRRSNLTKTPISISDARPVLF